MSTCRFCGKEVVWAVDEKGTKQILDPRPPVYVIVERDQRPDGTYGVGTYGVTRTKDAMVTHWATCPKTEAVKKSQEEKRGQNKREGSGADAGA